VLKLEFVERGRTDDDDGMNKLIDARTHQGLGVWVEQMAHVANHMAMDNYQAMVKNCAKGPMSEDILVV